QLTLSLDTRSDGLIPTHGLAAPSCPLGWPGGSKESKCHGQHGGTHFSARTAHATSNSYARASGHCPTDLTKAMRQPECAVLGPLLWTAKKLSDSNVGD